MALDASGNVYVVDQGNHRVQKFDPGGAFLAKWGSFGSDDGEFYFTGVREFAEGLAVDGTGNVYVNDPSNGRIQKFASVDGIAYTFVTKWGGFGSGDRDLGLAIGLVKSVDAASVYYVYVADDENMRIQKV